MRKKSLSMKVVPLMLTLVMILTMPGFAVLSAAETIETAVTENLQSSSLGTDLPDGLQMIGTIIDFESTEIPGTKSSAAVSRRAFDSRSGVHVLTVNPLSGSASTDHTWTLPLGSGQWDVSGQDIVRFEFDFYTEFLRPGANMFDMRVMSGSNILLGVRAQQGDSGNNEPWNTRLFAVTPMGITQLPDNLSFPRQTRFFVTLELNLATQFGSIRIENAAGLQKLFLEDIALPVDNVTGLQFGGFRALGQNWAGGAGAFDPVLLNYGFNTDNIAIFAGMYEGEIPVVHPTSISVTPGTAMIEFGAGSLPGNRMATFSANVLPVNAMDRTFIWSAIPADRLELTTNLDGSVTVSGRTAGTATLTATTSMLGVDGQSIASSATIIVNEVQAEVEPMPNFTWLIDQDYIFEFGTNFDPQTSPPLWIFQTGSVGSRPGGNGTWHWHAREISPQINHYKRFETAGQAGGRSVSGTLPETLQGSRIHVHFDWRMPSGNIGGTRNSLNLSLMGGGHSVVSLRAGSPPAGGGIEAGWRIGAFAGPMLGAADGSWNTDRIHILGAPGVTFGDNTQNVWYTVNITLNMNIQEATVSMVRRDVPDALLSTVRFPFTGDRVDGFRVNVERGAGQNHGLTGQGIDNLFFFTQDPSDHMVVKVAPPSILPELPGTNAGGLQQSWFVTVPLNGTPTINDIGLPETLDVYNFAGNRVTVPVTWTLAETPHAPLANPRPIVWNDTIPGVFTFSATLHPVPGKAVNYMLITQQIFVEVRRTQPLTTTPRPMEWLDRGVVAVPVNDGAGILVTWRLLVPEYEAGARFNVFRGDTVIASNLAATNFVDRDGNLGDYYRVELIGGMRSKAVRAWERNWIDILLQRPSDRENPANAFGGSGAQIVYTANDMSVADVTGDGRYEILVKWKPSQQQDPGLVARHTGETIFDLYTLDGDLLWRINLGINISSSAHHSTFNFFDLDQDGRAEFAIKTAEGTRVYLPDPITGLVAETFQGGRPAYVIGGDGTNNFAGNFNYHELLDFTGNRYLRGDAQGGAWFSHPSNIWPGGTTCPRRGVANTNATGRINNGPEFFTVFDGLNGLPIDTVEYVFPYGVNRGNWGDGNNNRSDRFAGAVAFLPKRGIDGEIPYPSVIEVRGHYGPHFVAAYQLINGEIVLLWRFVRTEWGIPDGGNHGMMVSDADRDGYDDLFFGSMALRHDGTLMWSANGTRGTIRGSHGDALHVAAMFPDSDGIYVMTPREAPAPFNAVVYEGTTGRMVWGFSSALGDVGRGVAANVIPLPGFEVWASGTPMDNIGTGQRVMQDINFGVGDQGNVSTNHRLFWTGNLLSELLDGRDSGLETPDRPLRIDRINFNTETSASNVELVQTLTGTLSNNGTKANPGLTADIFGDWREEILVRTEDNQNLRIYTTNFPTDYTIFTLMHDPTYRLQVNAQNTTYNQPPHLGFYLGESIRQQVLERELRIPLISIIGHELPPLSPVVPEPIVDEDFEAYEPVILMVLTEPSPKPWNDYELVINPGGTGSAQFEINRDLLTENQSLMLRDDYATTAGWLELRRSFPEISSGYVTVDIGFMQPVTATGARPLRITDSAGNEVARLDTRAGPAISVRNHDGTVFTEMGRYSANEWVRIRLIVDLNNKIFNAFFNGRRVGEFPFNNAAATGVARIESRTPGSAVRSHFIDNILITPYKKIEAPVNVNAVAGDRQVNLNWEAVWGASTYTVKKGLESGGPYQIIAAGLKETSHLITGLTNDVAYYFVVKAVTEDKMVSVLSDEVRSVPSTVPEMPENITYTQDFAVISLSWDPVPTADSYIIRYGIRKEALEHSLEVLTTTHTFDNLQPGQIYYFTITAKNDAGEGSPSQPLAIRAGDAKIYQAEYAIFPGSSTESIDDRNFTGSGYVNMSSVVGSYIEWTVGMDAAGPQTLRLYYALGRTDQTRPMSISVNGKVIRDRIEFEPTFAGAFPSWGVWRGLEINNVQLNKGPNKIRLTVLEFDGPNIDKLTVTGQPGLEYRVLRVESLGLGRVEVSPTGEVFPCTFVKGTTVTFNADPCNLFEFSHWSGGLTGSQNPAVVLVDRNLNIKAYFLPDLVHAEQAPGFAGLGIGTFGGFGGEVVTVTNNKEFRNAVKDNVSRIVQVSGSIDLGEGAWVPVGSFKTILGLGDDAELSGGGLLLTGSTQVIIRNLRLGNAITPGYDPAAGVDAEFDALQINNSAHIWVDQCTFKNDADIWVNNESSFDGLLDIINGSSYITISNSMFQNHNQAMLIGNSDTLFSDRGRFRVTLFNNWFRGTTQRHPRVRFGQVHVFNNYFDSVEMYGIGVGVEASIISENNYFRNTAEPWRYFDSTAQPGFIRSEGDLFRESGIIPEREEGVIWNPAEKYEYVLMAAESARSHARVRSGAGREGKAIRINNEQVTTDIRAHEITGTVVEKTTVRVHNNSILVSTREIDAYSDFRIPVYLNPGRNDFEIKANDDIVRFAVILEVPPVDIPEQPPVQPIAPVVPVTPAPPAEQPTVPVVPVTPLPAAEQPIIEGQRTVVELEGVIEVAAEAGTIEGEAAKLRAEVLSQAEALAILEKAVAADIASVGQIVALTLTGGEFVGEINLTFGFDVARVPTGQVPSVFVYNERTGRWVYLGGRVADGRITIFVNKFSKFGVFAADPLPELADIDNHWAQKSILTMAGMNIVEGYPDGDFKPDAAVTRAEFAAMLVRTLGIKDKPEEALRFKDAVDFGWAKGAIGAAAELGLVFGLEDRSFAGGKKMTRSEVAVMLERVIAKGLMRVEDREPIVFADENLFPQWAKSGIRVASRAGLVRGFADGSFGHERSITRAEAAAILYRLIAER